MAHHRKSIRLPDYNYSSPGAYFVTLVTWQREHLFGDVDNNGILILSKFGQLVKNEWLRLEQRFDYLHLDQFVVMPNHLHALLWIVQSNSVTTPDNHPPANPPLIGGKNGFKPPCPGSLSQILSSYKSTTTRLINGLRKTPGERVWQRNYYEQIVRVEDNLNAIRSYIQSNPANWVDDPEFQHESS
jgi:REP element-mobilizing transposase RayT